MMPDFIGSPLEVHRRRIAERVRDDHADGGRCPECRSDGGCRRVEVWAAEVAELEAELGGRPQ